MSEITDAATLSRHAGAPAVPVPRPGLHRLRLLSDAALGGDYSAKDFRTCDRDPDGLLGGGRAGRPRLARQQERAPQRRCPEWPITSVTRRPCAAQATSTPASSTRSPMGDCKRRCQRGCGAAASTGRRSAGYRATPVALAVREADDQGERPRAVSAVARCERSRTAGRAFRRHLRDGGAGPDLQQAAECSKPLALRSCPRCF